MPNETEVERLVVRLIGDDSSYRAMMRNAATASGELSGVSREVENAQRAVRDATNDTIDSFQESTIGAGGTIKSFRLLGGVATNLSAALGGIDNPLGAVLQGFGRISASTGTALQTIRAASVAAGATGLGGALALVGVAAAAAAIPIGIMLSAISAYGKGARQAEAATKNFQEALKRGAEVAASTPQGNLFMRDRRSIEESVNFAKEQYAKRNQTIADAEQARAMLENKHAKERQELAEGSWVGDLFKGGWNLVTNWETRTSTQQSQQQADMLEADQKIAAAKVHAKEATNQYAESLQRESSAISQAIIQGKAYIDTTNTEITSAEYLNQVMKDADKAYTEARRSAYTMTGQDGADYVGSTRMNFAWNEAIAAGANPTGAESVAHERAVDEVYKREKQAVEDRIALEMSSRRAEDESAEAQIRNANLRGVAAARQAAIDKTRIENEKALRDAEISHRTPSPPKDVTAAGDKAARMEMARQQADFALSVEKAAISEKYFAAELAAAKNPQDAALQSAVDAAKAYEEWCQANKDLVATEGEKQRAIIQTAAAHQLAMKYMQEGIALQQQYGEPLDKLIKAQDHLNTLKRHGAIDEKVYQKAMADEYGKAHKEWQSQFQGQRLQAIVGGTSEATAALQDYKLGSTAMPLDMVNKKGEEAKTPADLLAPVTDMAKGINRLVTIEESRAKNSVNVLLANL